MSTDLKKMVKAWENGIAYFPRRDLPEILLAMAAEIKANRKEIEGLKIKTKYMR